MDNLDGVLSFCGANCNFDGCFEIIFILIAWQAHPNMQEIKQSLVHLPVKNTSYLYLVAGNIGAVIMPWMIFFNSRL